jgi:hypothetical protein
MKALTISFAVFFCLAGCDQKPISETEAKADATRWFLSNCKAFHRDVKSFNGPEVSGPNKTAEGGFWYSFTWTHKSGQWGTLITVTDDGILNLSGFGDIPPEGE